MALKLDILANTAQLVREMKDAGASVEEISDALDDLVKDAADAERASVRSFKDIAKASDKAGRDIGKDFDKGFDKAKKGADEFKAEANSTAKESAASFDGSAESIGDAFQEVAANALGGFGPVGAAAGLALAAGIGAGTAALTGMQEASEETKQAIREMYQQAAEDGQSYLDESVIAMETTRQMFEERDKLQRESKDLSIDVVTLARAYAGDQEAINTAIAAGNDLLAEAEAKNKADLETLGAKPAKVDLEAEAVRGVLGALEAVQTEHTRNQQTAQKVVDAQKQQTAEAGKTKNALLDMAKGTYVANVKLNVDQSQLDAAKRNAELWARNGLNVAVTGTLTGRTWE